MIMSSRGRKALNDMADAQTKMEGMLVILDWMERQKLGDPNDYIGIVLAQVAWCGDLKEEAIDALLGEHYSFGEKFQPVKKRYEKFMEEVTARFQ